MPDAPHRRGAQWFREASFTSREEAKCTGECSRDSRTLVLGRKHVNKAAGKCITVGMRRRRDEKRSREERRASRKKREGKRGDRKRRERESPKLSERAPQKRKSHRPCAGWILCQGEFSTRFSSDKTARLLARDFCAPHKGDSFYGASSGALSRGEGKEGRSLAKGKRIRVSLSRMNFPRNKIAVQNSQVNLNCACRKGRKTAPLAVRPGQILNIDRARARALARLCMPFCLSPKARLCILYSPVENNFCDTSYGKTLGSLLTKISVKWKLEFLSIFNPTVFFFF